MENRSHSQPKRNPNPFFALIIGFCLLLPALVMGEDALPVIADQVFEVEENAPAGTIAGTVKADAEEGVSLVYAISGGEDAEAFIIDRATGELKVSGNRSLDYEARPTLSLTVSASAGEESSSALITINLKDIVKAVAETGAATAVTTTGAIISGTITNAVSGATAALQYSKTEFTAESFDPETAANKQLIEKGRESVPVQFALEGLEDGQIWYYRVVVKNSEGISYGKVEQFTTISIPRVESISLRDTNPTNSEVVGFFVTFSEPVQPKSVDETDFELDTATFDGGMPLRAVIERVELFTADASNRVFLVTVGGVSGDGILKLIFRDDNSVLSLKGIKLGGEETGDGDFTSGDFYTVDNTHPSIYHLLYTDEDRSVTYSFSVSDAPQEPKHLIVEFSSNDTILIPNTGSFVVTGDNSIRRIRITPSAHRHGSALISIKVRDEAGNISPSPINLNVVVRAVADPPLLTANDVSGPEDTRIALDITAALVDNDSSETLQDIRISGVPEGAGLSAGAPAGGGVYTFSSADELQGLYFIPEKDEFGIYPLTLSLAAVENEPNRDFVTRERAEAAVNFNVEVLPVNDAPAFELSTYLVERDEDFEEPVTIALTDLSPANEKEAVSYSLSPASVDFANISINEETGAVTITAVKDAFGREVIKVIADDGQAENNLYEKTFELIVKSVNDAPVFALNPERMEVEEDFTETYYVEIVQGHVPENEKEQQVHYSVAVQGGDAPIASVKVVEKDEKQQLEIKAVPNANGNQVFVVTAEEAIPVSEPNRTHTEEFELKINKVNDLPEFVLVPDNYTADEDFKDPLYALIKPLAVPADEQGQPVTYTVAVKGGDAPIAIAEIEEKEEGVFRLKFTSIENANGLQVFEVTANDGTDTYSQYFTLTITGINDAPAFTLSTDKVVRDEDFAGTVTVTVETTSSPANEKETITYSLSPATVDFANISIDAATGTVSITAKKDAFGAATITVIADDGQEVNSTHKESFELIVNSVNDAPVFTLSTDKVEKDEDFTETVTVTVETTSSPANEKETITYSLSPAPVDFANISIDAATGTVSITAKKDAVGAATITVIADDGQEVNSTHKESFELIVNSVNDAPVFTLSTDKVEKDEDFTETVTVTVETTSSPANEKETITYSLSPATVDFANISIDAATGTVSITAKKDAFGAATIKVIADDGQSVNSTHEESFELVVKSVNDAPVFTLSTDKVEKDEDFTETVTVTVETTSSPANEKETITYSLSPATVDFANISIDAATGTVSITAKKDAFGAATITVIADDGQSVNSTHEESFELIVKPVNDAPVFTLSTDKVEKEEDFAGTVTVTVETTSSPANEKETITYSLSPATVDFANISINRATGTVSITAKKDAFGTATIKVIADDGQAVNSTHEESFELIVNSVNDAPVFTLSTDKVEKDEDFAGTVTVTVETTSSPANEKDTITYSLSPATVDFANIRIDRATGTVSITAKKDAFGTATIKVIADDGQAVNSTHEETFELIVNPVNDAPVFTLSTDTVEKEEEFEGTETVTVETTSSPANEKETITYSLSPATVDFANIRIDRATGTVSITAKNDAFGSATIKVIADDGQAVNSTHEDSFELIVKPVNDAPVFTLSTDKVEKDEDFEGTETVTVKTTSSPANEKETITYSLSPATVDFANISIDRATGTVSITAKKDAFGAATIKVIADDGQAVNSTHEESFELIVNSVNDAPVFTLSTDRVEKDEDFTETIVVTVTDQSPANETKRITYSLSPASVDFANISFNSSNGEVTITSRPDLWGSAELIITAEDAEGATASRTLTLIVNAVNDYPVFTLSTDLVEKEEDFAELVTVTVETTSSPANEVETITYSLSPAGVNFANISIDPATGTVSITAKKDGFGSASITVIADDGQPANNLYKQSFSLIVHPVNNDHPVLNGKLADRTAYEHQPFEHIISIGQNAVFTDPDGNETLTFSASLTGGAALPDWLSFNAEGRAFSGTPETKDIGEYFILVRATDPDGQWIEDSFKLTVLNVNSAPEISDIDDVSVKLGSETPASVTFSVFDRETPGKDLQLTIASGNPALIPASAIDVSQGGANGEERTLTFYPPGIETLGSSVITVTVSDGEAETETTFVFTVEYNQLALNIPDLITPNGDNANDTWNIRFLSLYENNELRVFDRNGRVVFQAKNYSSNKEWDGTQNGRALPEGIYLYEIRLNGGEIVKKGTLTIAR